MTCTNSGLPNTVTLWYDNIQSGNALPGGSMDSGTFLFSTSDPLDMSKPVDGQYGMDSGVFYDVSSGQIVGAGYCA